MGRCRKNGMECRWRLKVLVVGVSWRVMVRMN